MRTLASAAKLLDQLISPQGSQRLLTELGFGSAVPVEGAHRESLSLPISVGNPYIARGAGPLRALAFVLDQPGELRSELTRIGTRLAASAPQMLWTLVAIDNSSNEVAVAAFDMSRLRPRIAALVARRNNIVDSDAETICAMAAARNESATLTHLRWIDILGRESISRRFFRTLEQLVSRLADSLPPPIDRTDAKELALLHSSRLLFLSFLETKGWLDGDHGFLGNRFTDCMVAGGSYHRRVLEPLFFGTLNTHPRKRAARAREFGRIPFLNGGLFARAPIERHHARSFLSDESLGDLFGELLSRYRFTAREDTTLWTEAAIDPEMLGKAFESLMSATDRKSSGAFYTPQSLVCTVAERSLAYSLTSPCANEAVATAALGGEIPPAPARRALLDRIDTLTVLDPACGSGAFLVHVLEVLSGLRIRLGDPRPLHAIRRQILTRSIFGVDINPTAVWLCELRLWLSMAIEDPEGDPLRVRPLPNLDRNIRIGDSLSGESFTDSPMRFPGRRVSAARDRYSRATGPRKRSLARVLDNIERDCSLSAAQTRVVRLRRERSEILAQVRSRDLFGERSHPDSATKTRLVRLKEDIRFAAKESRRITSGGALPFSFAARFADIATVGGFAIVIGNPPWIRPHNIDAHSRAALRRTYSAYRNPAWTAGSVTGGAGRGFGSQVDVAALFIERSIELLRPDGTCGLIVPSKLWRSLAGGGLREFVREQSQLRELHDLTEATQVFDAAVYPSVLITGKSEVGADVATDLTAVVHRHGTEQRWRMETERLPFDDSRGSPWLLLPDDARESFDRVREAGTPLASSVVGRPLLGVKTGCNEAFVVEVPSDSGGNHATDSGALTLVNSNSNHAEVESALLRPLLRGEALTPWVIAPGSTRIIWTHSNDGHPLATLPLNTKRYLAPRQRDLERRSDARGSRQWWMLFRTESANNSLPRVVWADIGRTPRAAILAAGDPCIPLNSCYVARCPTMCDALALTALINSPLAAAWLASVAEPARGGYRRFLGWTMSILPLPRDWPHARRILAPIAQRAIDGAPPADDALLDAVLEAYGLTRSDVDALLAWTT